MVSRQPLTTFLSGTPCHCRVQGTGSESHSTASHPGSGQPAACPGSPRRMTSESSCQKASTSAACYSASSDHKHALQWLFRVDDTRKGRQLQEDPENRVRSINDQARENAQRRCQPTGTHEMTKLLNLWTRSLLLTLDRLPSSPNLLDPGPFLTLVTLLVRFWHAQSPSPRASGAHPTPDPCPPTRTQD